jgi:mRNA interferase RelE/StbE
VKVVFAPRAAKELEALPESPRRRLLTAVQALGARPLAGKPLKGPLEGRRSLRVGEFRVIYRLSTVTHRVEILKVGHRAGIYRG